MELRPFIRGIAALVVVAVGIFLFSVVRESAARNVRATDSTFIPLVDNDALQPKDVTKIEVSLPGGAIRWEYRRIDGVWRLPDFAGVFALNGEVDNLIKILNQSRARPIAEYPRDQRRYGLLPDNVLTVTLYQDAARLVSVKFGALVPGALKDERYVLRNEDRAIYLLNANPASQFLDTEPPAMLDKNILPQALPHGVPSEISYSGSRVSEIRTLEIKPLPSAPRSAIQDFGKDAKKKREPTHEFIGTLRSGEKRMYDDGDGMMYVNKVLGLEFDKIVGSISPAQVEYQKFNEPILEVVLHYNAEKSIALAVSGSLLEGKYPILNRSTGQMFIISSEKVDALIPNVKVKQAE